MTALGPKSKLDINSVTASLSFHVFSILYYIISPGVTLSSQVCRSRIVDGLEETLAALVNNFKADPTILDNDGYNAVS